jgi:RNA polymerase sigma-70 factor (ECF subfamily)
LCGPGDADDLVQEVFLAAYRHWDGFSGRHESGVDPKPWLFTIAANACQRMHRRRVGEPAAVQSLDVEDAFSAPRLAVVDSAPDGLGEAMRREAQDAVESAIVALPDGYRLPLVLKDIVGLSLEQISQALGMPLGTVKTRVHRARLKLRDALDSTLPTRELAPAAYSAQVCLDLLTARQESLDRGVDMPGGNELVCERCSAVFAGLDLGLDLCRSMGNEPLSAELRTRLLEAIRKERP